MASLSMLDDPISLFIERLRSIKCQQQKSIRIPHKNYCPIPLINLLRFIASHEKQKSGLN